MKQSEVECLVHSRWTIDGKNKDIHPGLKLTCSTRTAEDMVKVGHAKLVQHLPYTPPPETVKEEAKVDPKEPAPENKDASEKVEEDKKVEEDTKDVEEDTKKKGSSKKK